MSHPLPIDGQWHPEGSAARMAASLLYDNKEYTLTTSEGETYSGPLSELDISSRLGNIERKIILTDGSVFTTSNNDAVDAAIKSLNNTSSFIHQIESRLHWVLLAIVITACSGVGFFKWGVPWLSYEIAHALPEKTNEIIAADSLKFLDKHMFDESKLSSEQQNKIRQHFNQHIAPLETNVSLNYTLHFRYWGLDDLSIPNAFALPSGDIILTDKFVELSESQSEIDAVLLHEMGHVVERHTLQMIVQSTLISASVILISGDNSALVDLGVGIGSMMISSNYSRKHESQADSYAFKNMLKANIDPANFSTIMARMTQYMEDEDNINTSLSEENSDSDKSLLDYLSSHPRTQERIKEAERYSLCFKRGDIECKE